MKLSAKELQIIEALLQGKKVSEITVKFNVDTNTVKSIVAKYREETKLPPKQYDLTDMCDILYNGRKIDSCRELHHGPAPNQHWKGIEKRCLACLIKQNNVNSKSSIDQLAKDVSWYFDRTPEAVKQMIYKLIRR